jgi:hypothetical protein
MTNEERAANETAIAYRELRDTFRVGTPEWKHADVEYQAVLRALYNVGKPPR